MLVLLLIILMITISFELLNFVLCSPYGPSFVFKNICFQNKIYISSVTFTMVVCHLSCECLILESVCFLQCRILYIFLMCKWSVCTRAHITFLLLPLSTTRSKLLQNSSCNFLAWNWSCVTMPIYKTASDQFFLLLNLNKFGHFSCYYCTAFQIVHLTCTNAE